jgi:hypothetical protein
VRTDAEYSLGALRRGGWREEVPLSRFVCVHAYMHVRVECRSSSNTGIIFKLAYGKQGPYGGSHAPDEAAAKAMGHELKGADHYYR